MSNVYGTAIYKKNVPALERLLRLVASAALVIGAALWIDDTRIRWLAVASGAMFALTGVFGFCPACYFAGRKLAA
ncbi:MAG: DUF2892 domain-containing protein [Myxococcales bacterium]|nr:DUF2892 domain-containing protein [Myxococcales bacterium]